MAGKQTSQMASADVKVQVYTGYTAKPLSRRPLKQGKLLLALMTPRGSFTRMVSLLAAGGRRDPGGLL